MPTEETTPPRRLTAAERRKNHPLRYKPASEAKSAERKHIATIRRPIILCPVPADMFKIPVLAYIGQQAIAKGYDPSALTFTASLRRNRKYFVEYVLFGLMAGPDVVVVAKDWPERVLTRSITADEMLNLYQRDASRHGKPDLWTDEGGLRQIVELKLGVFEDSGMLRMGDKLVGLSDKVPAGYTSTAWTGKKNLKRIDGASKA